MSQKRIAVLGAAGMAGHIMAEHLQRQPDYEVHATARTESPVPSTKLDVTDFAELEAWLRDLSPAVVVNCVGVLVQGASHNIANAILINSYLPHKLAEIGSRLDFQLVHISTDCVFSGITGAYTEDSVRDGDTSYARTKALGEVINDRDLTIRTSIVGPELKRDGTGLLDWFLKQHKQVAGFDQVFWSGVTTLELAKSVDACLRRESKGLLHLCPSQKISKYELLRLFKSVWHHDIEIASDSTQQCDKSLVNTRQDLLPNSPDYHTMCGELKVWMDSHPEYYSHYSDRK